MWFVYFVSSGKTGALYCGISTSPTLRVKMHNLGSGSKWCRAHRPVELIWASWVDGKSSALKIEWLFKQLTRLEKLSIVLSNQQEVSLDRRLERGRAF